MRKRRILLVDDEVGITRALAMYLEDPGGCEVQVENVGTRVLATARAFAPDLIFLDIVMPDAEGGTLAAAIKADPSLKNTPIVFLTALVSQDDLAAAADDGDHPSMLIGGYPFLAKPVDPDTVLAYVDKHVRRDAPR
jgi:CheY-like chemotaxis protein